MGLGHAVHARPFRLARRARRSPSRRWPITCSSGASSRRWRRGRPVPDIESRRRRGASRASAAADSGVGHHRPSRLHGLDGRQRALPGAVHRRLPVLPRVSRARPPPINPQLDIKTPLLVGFFLAGLVIHGGLQGWWIGPVLSSLSRERTVLGRDRPDRVQRQRADHLSRDARAGPRRRLQGRGRRRRGHRRRPDRDRQRAESRRARRCSAASSTARSARSSCSPPR